MNEPKLDYWMISIIEEKIYDMPQIGQHVGCAPSCANRFCKVGKRNLILSRMQDFREYYNELLE